jgi:hypothetical protein
MNKIQFEYDKQVRARNKISYITTINNKIKVLLHKKISIPKCHSRYLQTMKYYDEEITKLQYLTK